MRLARWAVLWTALIALSATPVLAQVVVSGDNNDVSQYVDCSQVQIAAQNQYGGQNAAANDNSTAEIANKFNITQNQVNACLGEAGGGGGDTTTGDTTTGDTTTGDTTTGDTTTGDTTTGKTADTDDEGDVMAGTIPEADELPNTGGPSGIALAAGCALLGVGLIVNRIFR